MFAGITVCIALLGMFALGVSFLYGVAVAASVAVALHGDRGADAAAGAARLLRDEGAAAARRAARSRPGELTTERRVRRLGALGGTLRDRPGADRRRSRRR